VTAGVEYDYDVFNLMVARRQYADESSPPIKSEHFIYDGSQIIQILDDSAQTQQRLLRGPAVDQIFAAEDATGELIWPLANHLNTARDFLDSSGNLLNHRQFDSFGNLTAESNPTATDFVFTFTGGYQDPLTTLIYRWHRWYDKRSGRWISEDPIGFPAGDANLSRYVNNLPTMNVDPTGLAAEQKPKSDASERARELERILPYVLDKLKQAAKDTKDVERFGVFLKAKDPKGKPEYKFLECTSKNATEMASPFVWWGSEKKRGGLLPKPGPDGKVSLDREEVAAEDLDTDYPIEFDWHTHPQSGDPWPSTQDGKHCKENDIVGVMIRYIGRMRGGKVEDDWFIWIVDTDGKTYEYTLPAKK
jgi:RHS repeat-associated protein